MKAALCETLDGPDAVVVRTVDDPGDPGTGQIRVAIGACGVSFADVLMTRGGYQVKPPLPFVVGGEAAGHVTALGADVEDFAVGDAVLVSAGCVEHAVMDASRATRIPEGVDIEAAASFRSNYTTALYGLERGRLRAGETLLVHGAGGGVGLAAVDVGKLMGATVIATAGSEAKLAVARELGADHLIDYRDGFREAVKEATEQRGADVIYDPVGGDVFDESMRCVAPFGRILIVGFTGGRAALAKTNHLLIKDAEAIGFTIGALGQRDPARAARIHRTLMNWLGAGRIKPYISHRVPLAQTADALKLIVNREVIGKAVVVP
ncbi:MAG: NADPH:quinone oxidoreductase family protein [Gammaproteobacteria bacterium]|nr:NADPH:quinone oxidoreductase family protein [Gammaproteobacteria bacterium]